MFPDFNESIALFPNPHTPDLGCFVRRKHELEIENGFQNLHVEFGQSIDFAPAYHQVYFRVKCGSAAFFQRGLVYQTVDATLPPPLLQQFPPQAILGGEYRPYPSEWQRFPTAQGQRLYWFFGQHRNPAGGGWNADAEVGHIYDLYENGTLSTVFYDDTGGDNDLNDFILEVAVVGRQSWVQVVQAENQATVHRRIEREALPVIKKRLARVI